MHRGTDAPAPATPAGSASHLPFTPRALRRLKARTNELGFAKGFADYCASCGISVRIEGDSSSWCKEGQGAILTASHRLGWEAIALLCLLGGYGREDVHVIAALHSVMARIFAGVIEKRETILHVMSSKRGWDKNPAMHVLARFMRWRARRQKRMSVNDIRVMNGRAMARCGQFAADGDVVLIHPAGKVGPIMVPWKPGIGIAVQAIPATAHHAVCIVPIHVPRFSRPRVFLALYRGKSSRPIEIVVQAGPAQTVEQLLGPPQTITGMTAEGIAGILRGAFMSHFAN
jgi:hypothetical protein